jgi:hypothetical protein
MVAMAYAYDKYKQKIFIEDAKRKEQDEYTCFCCEKQVIMKMGDVLEHHFAHKAEPGLPERDLQNKYDTKLREYNETYVHKRAKEIIIEQFRNFTLPSKNYDVTVKKDVNNENYNQKLVKIPEKTIKIVSCAPEKTIDDIRPDLFLDVVDDSLGEISILLLEIYVSHKVDYIKKQKICDKKFDCIEIHLNHLLKESNINDELIIKALNDTDNYKYLYHLHDEKNKDKSQEEYEHNLKKHNENIINKREQFIKVALNDNKEIVHVYDNNNISNTYYCIECKDLMSKNTHYFSHKNLNSKCSIFQHKKNAGVNYSQLLVLNRAIRYFKKNIISVKFSDYLTYTLEYSNHSKEDDGIYFQFKVLEIENLKLSFLVNLDEPRPYSKKHCLDFSDWKELARAKQDECNYFITDAFQVRLNHNEQILFKAKEQENIAKIKEEKARHHEIQNMKEITHFISKNNILIKKEKGFSKGMKCICCGSLLNLDTFHEKVNNCAFFNEKLTSFDKEKIQKNIDFYTLYNSLKKKKGTEYDINHYYESIKRNLNIQDLYYNLVDLTIENPIITSISIDEQSQSINIMAKHNNKEITFIIYNKKPYMYELERKDFFSYFFYFDNSKNNDDKIELISLTLNEKKYLNELIQEKIDDIKKQEAIDAEQIRLAIIAKQKELEKIETERIYEQRRKNIAALKEKEAEVKRMKRMKK